MKYSKWKLSANNFWLGDYCPSSRVSVWFVESNTSLTSSCGKWGQSSWIYLQEFKALGLHISWVTDSFKFLTMPFPYIDTILCTVAKIPRPPEACKPSWWIFMCLNGGTDISWGTFSFWIYETYLGAATLYHTIASLSYKRQSLLKNRSKLKVLSAHGLGHIQLPPPSTFISACQSSGNIIEKNCLFVYRMCNRLSRLFDDNVLLVASPPKTKCAFFLS